MGIKFQLFYNFHTSMLFSEKPGNKPVSLLSDIDLSSSQRSIHQIISLLLACRDTQEISYQLVDNMGTSKDSQMPTIGDNG